MRFAVFYIIFACLFFSGCAARSTSMTPDKQVMEARLERRGATVAVIGDQILIVIPSALIFKPYTSTVMVNSQPMLAMVADYINSFPNMLVNVNVYTGMTGNDVQDLSLSKQQAKHLEKALIVEGLDTRVLHAYGHGGAQLVSKNKQDWQYNMNYRVEITLEKLFV